ncbi:MAG: hypothetical protein JXA13_13645 [Anaerolineales bacterium]|nr:hypothetical protein [Anaerolineales bacterium]
MKRFWPVINTSIAAIAGFLTLLGYFIRNLKALKDFIVHGAVILAAFAILVGIANLFMVHLTKIRTRQEGNIYSFLLLTAMIVSLGFGLAFSMDPSGSNPDFMQGLFKSVIFPVETSLLALLAVTLLYASVRLLRTRTDWMSIVFLASAVIGLFTMVPLPFIGEIRILNGLRSFLMDYFVTAGARGILIGISLGVLTTGLRVLLGADRPFGGK